MSVITLGLNHTSAPLDLRGKLAFAPEQIAPALRALRERLASAAPEAALVSTCNRTELYLATDMAKGGELASPAMHLLADHAGLETSHLQQHTYLREGLEAAQIGRAHV